MKRAHGRVLLLCIPLAGLLAVPAGAATLKLSCAGKAPRNRDSAGTTLCASSPTSGRTIDGVVRNDAGQPVAGKITVTFKSWTPSPGGGFNIKPTGTREITATSTGQFHIHVNPATKQSLQFDLSADPTLGIAAGVSAAADVSRKLRTTLAKLGGGHVRVTVAGTTSRPIKVYIVDSGFGYQVPGVSPKNVDRLGRATFNLGSRHGTFAYYIDTGKLRDLFWDPGRPKFHI